MRFFFILSLVFICSQTGFSQQSGTGTVARIDGTRDQTVKKDTDKEAFEKAIALEDPFERIDALKAFIGEYGDSGLRTRAMESLASARAAAADTKLRSKDPVAAVDLFKLSVKEAPDPISDDLFSKVLVNIPINLFLLDQRDAAFEIANMLEARSSGNSKQLLRLATFYFTIKYATGARRLAEKARDIAPSDPLVYQSLGAAYRLGFDLQAAADTYAKALELDPDSVSIRQDLANMKRATGDPAAAEALYREILEEQPEDVDASTGLVLSLFEQGRRDEAERLLVKELGRNPSNVFLLTGAANWYASNGEPDLAIENAQEAVSLDQSAVWAYIVMGRAFMKKGDPVNAERSLLSAAGFSTSPTIAYELALARAAAGYYRDAGDVLKQFFIVENGKLVTDLDGRVGVEADNFTDLVSLERKSVLFTPVNAYEPDSDAEIKALLNFETVVEKQNVTPEELESAANSFIGADDVMRTHRQLFAAAKILDAGKSPEKAAKIAQDAIGGVEQSVEIAGPAAAVMADQLFEGRKTEAAAGKLLLVPEVEKSTLVRIMRGRIEELTARSLIASGDLQGAQVRLKRAVSVLPVDSAWWRSSMWRLGAVYEKLGDDQKALSNYAASYSSGDTTPEKKNLIEAVYKRLNGSLNGLDKLLATKQSEETTVASLFVKGGSASKTPVEDKQLDGEANETPEPDDAKTIGEITAVAEKPELSITDTVKAAEQIPDAVPETKLPEDVDLTVVSEANESNLIPAESSIEQQKPASVLPDISNEIEKLASEARLAEDPEVTEVRPLDAASVITAETETADALTAKTPVVGNADHEPEPALRAEEEVRLADILVQKPAEADTPVLQPIPVAIPGATVAISGKPIEAPPEIKSVDKDPEPDARAVEETKPVDQPAEKTEPDAGVVEETTPVDQPAEKTEPDAKVVEETTPVDQPVEKTGLAVNKVDESAVPTETNIADLPDVLKTDVSNEPAIENEDDVLETEPDQPSMVPAAELLKSADNPAIEKENAAAPTGLPAAEDNSAKTFTDTDLIDMGATRPRFVAANKIKPKPASCSVVVSQDSIALISNGAGFGIVVGVINYDKPYVLRASPSSPEHISITYEPEIGSMDGRAFFIVRSVSKTVGKYSVLFETPCGNKSVPVEVY